jgi:hypothetical protein
MTKQSLRKDAMGMHEAQLQELMDDKYVEPCFFQITEDPPPRSQSHDHRFKRIIEQNDWSPFFSHI